MRCLCCNKPLKTDNELNWHKSCVKRFFGTSDIPEFELDDDAFDSIVAENTNKGYTVTGVQKKLSLHLYRDAANNRKLTLVNYPTGYILKPQSPDFDELPQSEQLIMLMADKAGIFTVPHALLKSNGEYSYITKRVDRIITETDCTMLAMEDFCQLEKRLTENKYDSSYERCGKVIRKYSSRAGIDMSEFFIRVVFSFIVGNSDMHLKNFSLIQNKDNSDEYFLSPAYDLLPANVHMPEDKDQMALTVNGKKRNIRRNDFIKLAVNCNIDKKAAERMIDRLVGMEDTFLSMCAESYLSDNLKESISMIISDRTNALRKVGQK